MACSVAILVGGMGTRLKGEVGAKPKCLVPVAGAPFIDHMLRWLSRSGFTELVLLTGHGAEAVALYVGDGHSWGCAVNYSMEPRPLGTAGAVKNAAALLSDPFLLLNGDTLASVDLPDLLSCHVSRPGASVTIALARMEDASDYGSVVLDSDCRVTAFREKQPGAGLVNAGVYCMSRQVLSGMAPDTRMSVETELLPRLVSQYAGVYGFPFDGVFVDIGTPERLREAQSHPLFHSIR